VEGWQSWLADKFREAIPSFPTAFLDDFVMDKEIAMLPRFESQQGTTFISIFDSKIPEF
jgi:hypothetical protein